MWYLLAASLAFRTRLFGNHTAAFTAADLVALPRPEQN